MNQTEVKDLRGFREKAIDDLEDLKNRYLNLIRSNGSEAESDQSKIKSLERAVRLLPGLLKTEESLRSSVEEQKKREQLERDLEPLFAVLRQVLGAEFDRRREDILAALEAELKSNGA